MTLWNAKPTHSEFSYLYTNCQSLTSLWDGGNVGRTMLTCLYPTEKYRESGGNGLGSGRKGGDFRFDSICQLEPMDCPQWPLNNVEVSRIRKLSNA